MITIINNLAHRLLSVFCIFLKLGNILPLRHRCCDGSYVAFTAPSRALSCFLPV